MKTVFNIILALYFFHQLFFGEGWYAVFCRFLVFGCVVYWLVSVYRVNKQEQEQAKLGKQQSATVNKEAGQETKADAMDGEVDETTQGDSKWEASEVEMMDGPYGRAPYGRAPYGGVIWNDEYTIDELIFKDGVYYYNQNSEEWEEDDEDS